MRGHFSRLSFDPRRHLAAVLDQQGSVGLDADQNEGIQILLHRLGIQNIDIIGSCGRPRGAPGLDLSVIGNTITTVSVQLSPGRFYAGGLPVEVEQPLDFGAQPDWPIPTPAQWTTIPNNGEPWPGLDVSALAPDGSMRRDLFYVEAWLRHKTALNDEAERQQAADDGRAAPGAPGWNELPEVGSLIRERALGGPETGTRLQTVAQVKYWTLLDESITDCGGACAALATARPPNTTGMLQVTVSATTAPIDPCTEPLAGGYAGAENRMYRVEIHDPGGVGTATFKWSNENGAMVVRVTEPAYSAIAAGGDIVIQSKGDDETTALRANDWVELCGEDTELGVWHNSLAQLVADPAPQTDGTWKVKLTRNVVVPRAPFLRRWSDNAHTITALHTAFPLSDDSAAAVTFFDDHGGPDGSAYFHELDYWTWSGRTITREIDPEDITQRPQQVQGIERAYCCLGIVTWRGPGDDMSNRVDPCLDVFPPLTDITAADVHVVDTCTPRLGVENLQQVFDTQCAERVLRYVSGDGQEGLPSHALAGALVVGVEDGFGRPQGGVIVTFTIEPDLAGQGTVSGGTAISPTQVAGTTGADGLAQCQWTLAPGVGSNTLSASIGAARLPVMFHAMGVVAEATGTWPTIAGDAQKPNWTNDRPLALSVFAAGLRVTFTDDMNPTTVTPSTFIVTLEVPFHDPTGFWCKHSLIAAGVITPPAAGSRTWTYHPQPPVTPAALNEWTLVASREFREHALRCRVVLLGDTILSTAGLPLDAEAVGQIATDPVTGQSYTDLILPSGDGRRGGTFRSWFWLVQDVPRVVGITIPSAHVLGGVPLTGTVTLSDVAPAGFAVHLASSDSGHAQVPDPLPIPEGQASATFQITTRPTLTAAPVTITATTTVGPPQSTTVTIDPPALSQVTVDETDIALNPGDAIDIGGAVVLSGDAPPLFFVTLGATDQRATVSPKQLTIPPNSSAGDFTVTVTLPRGVSYRFRVAVGRGAEHQVSPEVFVHIPPPGPGPQPVRAADVRPPSVGIEGAGRVVGRSLTDVPGVDGGFFRRLTAAGVTTPTALAQIDQARLARILGIPEQRAQEIIRAAQALLGP